MSREKSTEAKPRRAYHSLKNKNEDESCYTFSIKSRSLLLNRLRLFLWKIDETSGDLSLQAWFPINFEFSPLTSPLGTIRASEHRFSSKQDAQSLKVFSGLRRFRDVTDSNVQGTCFSCSMGIGNASNTTPETQQTDPTILPRTDDGTTSP